MKGRPDFGMRGTNSGAACKNRAHGREQFRLAVAVKVPGIEAEAADDMSRQYRLQSIASPRIVMSAC